MSRTNTSHRYRLLLGWSLLAGCAILAALWFSADRQAAGQDRGTPAADNGVAKAESLSRAFRSAAKQVMPTVVTIRTKVKPQTPRSSQAPGPRENPFKGTPFEDFFDEFENHPGFRMPDRSPRQGLGSGVVIDPKGVVLTNNHVVEGADEVLVELGDGRQLKATDIHTDPQTDLAVLRIEVDEALPAARLGDSDKLEIGDWVIAVGNPFELELTVSAGIISAKGRALSAGRRANFLQTDAAINPGNSGGPLVNLAGEVVGINTAIASNTGTYNGIGFAIPANLAKWVTSQLIEKGTVQRAYLGVAIAELDSQVAAQLGVDVRRGVLVNEVYPDTPAARAGIKAGDVILRFSGHPVSNPRELQAAVERAPTDSRQDVDVIREGKRQTLQVVLKALPEDFGLAARPRSMPSDSDTETYASDDLGLEVGELTETLAKKLGYDNVKGVLIVEVDPAGLAAGAGIDEGMVILRVGQQSVASLADFRKAMKSVSLEQGVLLLVRTPQGNRFVVLQST